MRYIGQKSRKVKAVFRRRAEPMLGRDSWLACIAARSATLRAERHY